MDNSDIMDIMITTITTFAIYIPTYGTYYIHIYCDKTDITGIMDYCQILNKYSIYITSVFMNPIICVYLVNHGFTIALNGSVSHSKGCIYVLGYI